jgi:hypothetical protein
MRSHETDQPVAPSPHVAVSRDADSADPAKVRAAVSGSKEAISSTTVRSLQRLAGNLSVGSLLSEEQPSPVHDVVNSGGGAPLDPATRVVMEQRLGQDLSDVRVHTDAKADESARSVNAQAYTVGSDVVFKSGQYAPDTPSGLHTLAHELTHVVQQRSGPVDGTEAAGGIKLSDPGDRFEQAAERSADRVTSEPASPTPAGSPAAASASVQREAKPEEEEEVQTLAIQRAGADDEVEEEDKKAGPS